MICEVSNSTIQGKEEHVGVGETDVPDIQWNFYTIVRCKLWIFMNNHACKVGHPERYSVKASDEEKYNIAKVVSLIPSPLLLTLSLKPISQCLLCDDKDPGMLHRSCKL